MDEVLFAKIQNVLLDLICNKNETMTVDDATLELVTIVETAQQSQTKHGPYNLIPCYCQCEECRQARGELPMKGIHNDR